MSVFKILAVVAVFYAIYFFFFRKKLSPPKNDAEELAPCAKCGTFVTPKDAIVKGGKLYCSKECAGVK